MKARTKRRILERLRPTPFGELSRWRKVRRIGNGLLLVSAGAMAVSAATASTDWDITSDDPPPTAGRRKPKTSSSADASGPAASKDAKESSKPSTS